MHYLLYVVVSPERSNTIRSLIEHPSNEFGEPLSDAALYSRIENLVRPVLIPFQQLDDERFSSVLCHCVLPDGRDRLAEHLESLDISAEAEPRCADCRGSGVLHANVGFGPWDFFLLGGRWSGYFNPDFEPPNIRHRRELIDGNYASVDQVGGLFERDWDRFAPFTVLTENSVGEHTWTESDYAPMESGSEWHQTVLALFEPLAGDRLVFVIDYHW